LPGSHADIAESEVRVISPGWVAKLPYDVPQPGTYTLPKVTKAAGGTVLDVNGNELDLDSLFGDRIVLLTFIYSSCTDLNGCPLATAVFYKVKERFKNIPQLADKIRLISISFDPEHDTPEVMRLYGAGFEGGQPEWLFLTTESEKALLPITNKYGQMVIKEYNEEGEYTGSMSHVLRAFLIDRSKNIRQEYSVSFLHDELVSTDIKTLLIEDGISIEDAFEG
jgi:cytochrome c peroxidase